MTMSLKRVTDPVFTACAGGRVTELGGHLHRRMVLQPCFCGPDDAFVAIGGEDGRVHVWHVATGALAGVMHAHTGTVSAVRPVAPRPVHAVAGSPNEAGGGSTRVLMCSAADDGTVVLWA